MSRKSPLKISRILHAGYVFECDETTIAFDPIFENPFSRNCHAFPNVEFDLQQIEQLRLSAVFISHFHDDHCSLESLDFLDRKTPIYIYCIFEDLFSWIRELGFAEVHSLKLDQSIAIGSFIVTPRRALDADVDSIFHIQAAGLNILNVVDSWIDVPTLDILAKMAPWDLVLWPFQTMREIEVLSPLRALPAPEELPPEWIEQLLILKPKYIVPSSCQFVQESWSWYNHAFFPISYAQFKKEIEAALPETSVLRINPSVTISLNKNSWEKSTPLSWVFPKGDQDVDYDYQRDLNVPSTQSLAKKFTPLTVDQAKEVIDYCRSGLLTKFRSLDEPEDIYFRKSRTWLLSVFDHEGQAVHFRYKMKNNKIELVDNDEADLSWTTEVPIAKLYAALVFGESLTSMYIRINDRFFSPEIEKEIEFVDIVEDPLVRCLFSGIFGAYQAAQLKRLRTAGRTSSRI